MQLCRLCWQGQLVSHLDALGRLKSLGELAPRNTHTRSLITPIERGPLTTRTKNVPFVLLRFNVTHTLSARDALSARCWRCCRSPKHGNVLAIIQRLRYRPAYCQIGSRREDHRRVPVCCWPSAMKRNLDPPQASHRGSKRRQRWVT